MAKPKIRVGTAFVSIEHPENYITYDIQCKYDYYYAHETYYQPEEVEFDVYDILVTHVEGQRVMHKEDEELPDWITKDMLKEKVYEEYVENE